MDTEIASENKNVLNVFDGIIFKHLERLIGSGYGVGELPLNSATISLIILLMDRENEINRFPSDETNRYDIKSLIKDFEEFGFDAAYDVNMVVEEMIRKGYIHTEDHRLIPQKPTISMARLIDLIFPKMPGMNLVAYLVQTMDEVTSKRKDLDSAVSQFDQVLQMQSVPLKKESNQSEITMVSDTSDDTENELKPPAILGRKSSDNFSDPSNASSAGPKVLSSEAYKGKIEIRKVDFGTSGLEDVDPDKKSSDEHKPIQNEASGTPINHTETEPHDDADSIISDTKLTPYFKKSEEAVSVEQNPNINDGVTKLAILDSADDNEHSLSDPTSTEQDEERVDQNEDDPGTTDEKEIIKDDDIEKRITAFEEDLALECPICKQSKVTVENTGTGKPYYKCSNKDCNFISWGKPYHIPCPKCNNPFLIEASDPTGEAILKCPRATCRYRKKTLSDITDDQRQYNESTTLKSSKTTPISRKPRRKVVRRRVVRRKK